MQDNNILPYIKDVLENMPIDWLNLTTHRLDIYNESLAKTQFLEEFELLFKSGSVASGSLSELPTAYDYIRLGHPLSTILEWTIAGQHKVSADSVISFSSLTMPILAILRKNQFENKKTQIVYTGELPNAFDAEAIESIYAYSFELKQVTSENEISDFDGSTVFVSEQNNWSFDLTYKVDFYIKTDAQFGSVLLMNGEGKKSYIKEIQHVRRRETISMTPINCLAVLKSLVGLDSNVSTSSREEDKASVYKSIKGITGSNSKPVAASSGLSMQYAIMMGLVDYAMENHKGKDIKFIVPPNCYGGTNDQARRVAACIDNVEVVDLPVDGGRDMVESIDSVLNEIANVDAVPYIIARLPTDYFLTIHSSFPPRTRWSRLRGVARNIVGFSIILIGLLMLVLPGQGMLTILIGACLLDIPGIRRLKTRLLRRSRVQAGIDWIRIKCGKPRMSWPST